MLKFISWGIYLKGLLIVVPLYYLVVGTFVFRAVIRRWIYGKPRRLFKPVTASSDPRVQMEQLDIDMPQGVTQDTFTNTSCDRSAKLDDKVNADSPVKPAADGFEKEVVFQASESFPNLNDLKGQGQSILR